MITRRSFAALAFGVGATALFGRFLRIPGASAAESGKRFAVMKTEAEWRKVLTPAQYDVLREEGTSPFHQKIEIAPFWRLRHAASVERLVPSRRRVRQAMPGKATADFLILDEKIDPPLFN